MKFFDPALYGSIVFPQQHETIPKLPRLRCGLEGLTLPFLVAA